MRSAKSADDVSGAMPAMSDNISLNCDVLLSTIITGSGSGSGVVTVTTGAGFAVVVVAFGMLVVGRRVVVAPPVTFGRAVVDATVGRAVVAENAAQVTMAKANIEHFDKNLIVLFISLFQYCACGIIKFAQICCNRLFD